jgi:preprotein translocase subunit SecG
MNLFATLRYLVFVVVLVFALIHLALAASLTSFIGTLLTFPGFAVAVSVLTLVIAIPMLVVDFIRKGSVISWVATELGWCGLLWVLWLASAALSTSSLIIGDCAGDSLCQQYQALQGFAWLTWLLLTAYIIIVIVLAILATVKGHSRAWLSPASDLSFTPTHTASGEPKIPPFNNNAYGGSPAPNVYAGTPNAYGGTPGAYPPGQPQPGYQSPQTTGYTQYPAAGQPGYQPGPGVAQV